MSKYLCTCRARASDRVGNCLSNLTFINCNSRHHDFYYHRLQPERKRNFHRDELLEHILIRWPGGQERQKYFEQSPMQTGRFMK